MMRKDVYHDGEIAVQVRAGERAMGARHGALLADAITVRARPFVAEQRTVAIATADPDGRLWASLWLGEPGFVGSTDGRTVTIARDRLHIDREDPVLGLLRDESQVGLLAIELGSRRRLRVNGAVSALAADTIEVEVREAFPNCPKYIQRRLLRPDAGAPSLDGHATGAATGTSLDDARCAFIAAADTSFVASHHAERGADVSHRGGATGFVRVTDDHTLRIPDYPGNSMFQTLGNFEVDGRAGLVVVAFERGRLLSLTGRAQLSFGAEDPAHPSGGTGRYWSFSVERWIEYAMPATYHWELIDESPFNPPPFPDR